MDSALEPEQEDLKYLKHLKQEPTVGQAFRSPILPLWHFLTSAFADFAGNVVQLLFGKFNL